MRKFSVILLSFCFTVVFGARADLLPGPDHAAGRLDAPVRAPGPGVYLKAAPCGQGAEVVEVEPRQPAAKARLVEGDKIIAVDNVSVAGFTAQDVAAMLHTETGVVTLLVVAPNRRVRSVDLRP